MAVTLQQIAEKAGVSRGTVDRALNNRGRINAQVAERIREIAKEMGYQPNRAGRALAMSRHSIKIGVIIQSSETPFMKKVLIGTADAKQEVERLGAEVCVKKIKEVDADRVIQTMEKMKQDGINGIALVPCEDEGLKNTVNRFVEEYHIPVVTFNSDIDNTKRACFVGQDAVQSGKVAAGLMAEILPQNGKIQVISGYPSNRSHKNRTRSFIKELKSSRQDIEILDVQYAYDDAKIAETITREMLKAHDDLAGIYLSASGADSVCHVLEELKKAGKVKVISNDLTSRNERCLRKGAIQFLLGQNAYVQGYEPVMILFNKLFDGVDPEQEYIYTEIVIKTKYNL